MNVIRSGAGSFGEGGWWRLYHQWSQCDGLQFYPEVHRVCFVFIVDALGRINVHGIVTAHQGTFLPSPESF